MGSVTLFNAVRMKDIEDNTVVSGFVDIDGHLLLQKRNETTIDAGLVKGQNGEDGLNGLDGKSAYQIWLDNGNVGSEEDFLESLIGPPGPSGSAVMTPSSVVVGSGSSTILSDGTVQFTNASSVLLNGVFNGLGVDAYDVDYHVESSTKTDIKLAFAVAGTLTTGNKCSFERFYGRGSTATAVMNPAQETFSLGITNAFEFFDGRIRIVSPKIPVVPTKLDWRMGLHATSLAVADNHAVVMGSGIFSGTESLDGLQLSWLTTSATLTGWIRVVKTA